MSATVWSYHWDTIRAPIGERKSDSIYAWCLDRQNKPNLVRFEEEYSYFYIQLPRRVNHVMINWKAKKLQLVNLINRRILKGNKADINRNSLPLTTKIVDRELLCFYDQKKVSLLKLTFFNQAQANFAASRFNYPIYLDSVTGKKRSTYKFNVLENNISTINRMMARSNCGYAQWFTIPVKKPTTPVSWLEREYIATGDPKPIDPKETRQWAGSVGIMCYDIETITDNERMPNADNAGHWVVSIAVTYKRYHADKMQVINLAIGDAVCPSGQEIRHYKTEQSMLQGFLDLIVELDPEVLTGYNIYGFDNPYIWTRIESYPDIHFDPRLCRLRNEQIRYNDFSWYSSAYGEREINQIKMSGRIDVDVLAYVKANYKLPINKLDYAAKKILGPSKGKIDLDYDELFRIWRNYLQAMYYKDNMAHLTDQTKRRKITKNYLHWKRQIARTIEYGARDTIITHQIFERADIVTANREVCNIVNINIQDVLNRGQQMRGLSVIYKFCNSLNIVLNKVAYGTDIPYKGGFVFDSMTGTHEDVMCPDFNSLYPSIIIALNICYSTLIKPERWHLFDEKDCHIITWIDDLTNKEREYRFVKAHIKEGILPQLLKDLLDTRYKVKGEMKMETSSLMKNILDKRQLALKVVANSIYGLTGVGYDKGVLPMRPISASVTAAGRKFILQAADYVRKKYNATVVYGDTDSIMFKVPGYSGAAAIDFGLKVTDELSSIFPPAIKMELEKTGRILCITKKKYMYWKYDDRKTTDGKPNPKYGKFLPIDDPASMELRGNILVRRDNCDFQRQVYEKLLHNILEKKPIIESYDLVCRYIFRLVKGDVELEDLMMTAKMGSHYKEKTYKLNVFRDCLRQRGRYISPGERFGYTVVAESGNYLGQKMRLIEEIEKNPNKWKIDYTYYFDLLSRKNLDQLWEAGYAHIINATLLAESDRVYSKILTLISNDLDCDLAQFYRADFNGNTSYHNFNHLNKVYCNKDVKKKDCSRLVWQLHKSIEFYRKMYITGHNDPLWIDFRRVCQTMFRAYTKQGYVGLENMAKRIRAKLVQQV